MFDILMKLSSLTSNSRTKEHVIHRSTLILQPRQFPPDDFGPDSEAFVGYTLFVKIFARIKFFANLHSKTKMRDILYDNYALQG